MIVGPGSFISPELDIADDVHIGANVQLTGRGQIGPGVRIGHGTILEGDIRIGGGCSIAPHVLVMGRVVMGEANDIGHGATIGGAPEHPDHPHSDGWIEIGSRNVFRERCTVNMPTTEALTRVGNDNYFMHGVHIAHDCRVGDHVKIAPLTTLAGHVEIDDYVYLGLHTAVHQRRRIGMHCMVGMTSAVMKHLPPFATLVMGQFRKVNAVGLRLRGFSDESIAQIEGRYGLLDMAVSCKPTAAESIAEIDRFLNYYEPQMTYLPRLVGAQA
jgi:UDP-N-acetylglucosamine acyltransferase